MANKESSRQQLYRQTFREELEEQYQDWMQNNWTRWGQRRASFQVPSPDSLSVPVVSVELEGVIE